MARASWTGVIQFGLVTIPVRLERASIPHDVHFHLLHGKDGGRIHHKRICSIDGQEVPLEEVVKGYAIEDGEQIAVTQEELALLETYGPRTISIEDFVEGQEIDPLYFERAYYVVPEDNPDARKGYQLLRSAMASSGREAIARVTMRMREHLCALSVARDTLILTTLRYATEVVAPPDLEPTLEMAPLDAEVAMAEQLIDAMTTRFRPERYRDDYREHVVSLLRHKARDVVSNSGKLAEPTATMNLAESLAASLKGRREQAHPTTHGEGPSAPH